MNQRQLSSPIHKLPSGRYQVTFRDSERKLTRRSFDKQSEAQQFLDETRQAVRNHTYISPAKVPTVKEAATEWLEAKKVTKSRYGGLRKENTIKYWQQHIDGYIVPELGNSKLNSLTLAFVEAIRDRWALNPKLSPTSVNRFLTTLNSIIDRQVGRTIHFNPIVKIERLAAGKNEVGENEEGLEVRESDVYSPDELQLLLSKVRPGFDKTALETFIFTGIRHGECLGLMWKDINFDQQEIFIRRNWADNYRDGEPVFYSPKTKSSIRRIRIPDELILSLKKWKLQCSPSNMIWFSESQMVHLILGRKLGRRLIMLLGQVE